MPLILNPAGSNPLNLVTLSAAQSALAEVLPSDASYLPTAITTASSTARKLLAPWRIHGAS